MTWVCWNSCVQDCMYPGFRHAAPAVDYCALLFPRISQNYKHYSQQHTYNLYGDSDAQCYHNWQSYAQHKIFSRLYIIRGNSLVSTKKHWNKKNCKQHWHAATSLEDISEPAGRMQLACYTTYEPWRDYHSAMRKRWSCAARCSTVHERSVHNVKCQQTVV